MVEVNDLALHLLDESVPAKDLSLMRQAAVPRRAPNSSRRSPASTRSRPAFKLTISVRDDQLWAQATGQGAFQLFAKSRSASSPGSRRSRSSSRKARRRPRSPSTRAA